MKRKKPRDPYQTLGVDRTASDADIRKAYRRLALDNHPDRNAGDEKAARRYRQVTAAYELLTDPVRRKEYDETGRVTERADKLSRIADIVHTALMKSIEKACQKTMGRPEKVDIAADMRQWVEQRQHEAKSKIKEVTESMNRLEATLGRWRVKGDEPNLPQKMVESAVQDHRITLEKLGRKLGDLTLAAEYLADCSFDVEVDKSKSASKTGQMSLGEFAASVMGTNSTSPLAGWYGIGTIDTEGPK